MSVYATDLNTDSLLVCHDVVTHETARITVYEEIEKGVRDTGRSVHLNREEAGAVYKSLRTFLRTCPTCGHGRSYGEPLRGN